MEERTRRPEELMSSREIKVFSALDLRIPSEVVRGGFYFDER